MAASVQDLIEYCLTRVARIKEGKARTIAHHFGDLKSFVEADEETFRSIRLVGSESPISLSSSELVGIKKAQSFDTLDVGLSPNENLTKIIAGEFLDTQVKSIEALTIEELNCNPMLIKSLKLETSDDLIRYYVYQGVGRSIVTSFGFHVQKLLLYSGENIHDAKDAPSEHGTRWDLIKEIGQVKHWLEVKSGPNDLNKTQVISYKEAIERAEQLGDKAYIGETYGKRDMQTVTHHLYRKELPEWSRRTLIGRELWAFTSDDPLYHEKLMSMLTEVADSILDSKNVISCIEDKVKELLSEFNEKYSSVQEFVDSLW